MSDVTPAGRLIAVEGTRGRDIAAAAHRVWDTLRAGGKEGGISWWDASGTFFEARQVKRKDFVPSPRTLILFYAVDLHFRLKWEISPLLAEGRTVVAAPYTGTLRAYGRAAGVPKAWLEAVLAPIRSADITLRAKERSLRTGWTGDADEGFCETCAVAMRNDGQRIDPVDLRRAMIDILERRERNGGVERVRKKVLKRLAGK